ncbi:3-ketoacyl-ACP reductase, partial [Priestia megaterium]
NNFDYYCSSGSFQPAIIFEHLSRHLDPFYKNNRSFQIWAHVEWGQQEGIVPILEEFENEADKLVNKGGLH